MGYSKETYQKAKDLIFQRKLKAENDAEIRQQRLFAKIPRAKEITKELTACGTAAARAVVKGGNAKDELEKLKEKSLSLQSELHSLLVLNNLPTDYTEPKYVCKKCCDSGYIEQNNKTITCECMKKALADIACEELNKTSPLTLSTFETFNLDYYSMDVENNSVSPYTRMSKIFSFCKSYANSFSTESGSLLMRGATGLGKTHLSLAIANEIIRKGFSVVYVSAPAILSKLEKLHFSSKYEEESNTEQTLTECDLLIIDDIGTEFSSPFTVAALYNIFNTRILSGKPLILNTNLTISELEKEYSQRFVSRVMGSCTKMDFIGKDVRSIRRKV
ncbi:MAG: ATP-binding protein [Acutalibacteraceae bacterium]